MVPQRHGHWSVAPERRVMSIPHRTNGSWWFGIIGTAHLPMSVVHRTELVHFSDQIVDVVGTPTIVAKYEH